MKLKHKLRPLTLLLLFAVGTLFVSFSPLLTGTAAAADAYGCEYEYTSADKSKIKRSGCDKGVKDGVFTSEDPGVWNKAWGFKDGSCESKIFQQYEGDPLQLGGKVKTSSACENPPAVATITVKEGVADPEVVDENTAQSAQLAALIGKLGSLIDKECKSDESLPSNMQYCHTGWETQITTCFNKVFPKIDPTDKNADKKFNTQFSDCLHKALTNPPKKQKIIDALGGNAYSDLVAAGEAALNTGEDEDGGDACNVSGNPLTWIICPIFDGIGSLSDALLKYFVEGFLKTDPISTSRLNEDGTTNGVYQAWSAFRVYGDIFLVIALLVIVFGEAIGGGLIDAYTAKKVLPRLLVAAILINLSLYIVAILVDITNILGQTVGNIIVAPFSDISLSPEGWKLGFTAGISGLGAAAGASIVAFLIADIGVVALIGPYFPFLLLMVIAPVFLAILLLYITMALRKAIIMALVLVSPVAFALYCLPNTEKYFRQWWDLLFKTLMIYPIVMIVFAVADVLAYTSIQANGGGSIWGYILAFFLQFLPLFLIPYAFKLAGGVIGRIHDVASGFGKRGLEGIKGDARDPNSMRARATRRRREGAIRQRTKVFEGLEGAELSAADRAAAARGRGKNRRARAWRASSSVASRLAGTANYGDLEALRSGLNKEEGEIRDLKTGYGPDDSVRAFFATQNADGNWVSRTTGKRFSAAQSRKAQKLYGGTSSAQTAIDYELGKAEPQQYEQMVLDTASLLEEKGFSTGEINGIMKGVGFKNQGKYLDLKHSSFDKDENGQWRRTINYGSLAQNAATDFGSYPISNMKPAPIEKLAEAHRQAEAALAGEGQVRASADFQSKSAAEQQQAIDAHYASYGFKAADVNSATGARTAREVAETTRADVESTAATLDMSRRMQGGRAASSTAPGATVIPAGDGGEPIPGASGAPGRVDIAIQNLVQQTNASIAARNPQGGGTPPATTP